MPDACKVVLCFLVTAAIVVYTDGKEVKCSTDAADPYSASCEDGNQYSIADFNYDKEFVYRCCCKKS